MHRVMSILILNSSRADKALLSKSLASLALPNAQAVRYDWSVWRLVFTVCWSSLWLRALFADVQTKARLLAIIG